MDENQFWVAIWRTVGAVFLAAVLVSVGSCQATNYHIVEAVKAGADPQAAACALSGNTDRVKGVICLEALKRGAVE